MYIVKAYRSGVYKPEIDRIKNEETKSGPFETREEASRFATGLAKAGQCYRAEIVPHVYSPDSALTLATESYNAAQRLLADTPRYQVAYITEAIETLSKAIGYLRSHMELIEEAGP